MLANGYIRGFSDPIAERLYNSPYDFNDAGHEFGLDRLLDEAQNPEDILRLFSEWTIFEYESPVFGGTTGLEYFLRENPCNLSEQNLREYESLRENIFGLFEVINVERGRGTEVEHIATGKKYFIHDISMSLSVSVPSMSWMRIAPVKGLYHLFSGITLSLPMTASGCFKKMFREDPVKKISMIGALSLMFSKSENTDRVEMKNVPHVPLKIAEQNFVDILKRSGMDQFFSLRTFRRWMSNQKKYGTRFAIQAIVGLIPNDPAQELEEEIMNATMEYINALLQSSSNKKSPSSLQQDKEDGFPLFESDIYAREEYVEPLHEAMCLMKQQKFEEAFGLYEEALQNMFDDRVPLVDVFRVYANAGICCTALSTEEFFGVELLQAALRINPQYEFARKEMSRHAPSIIYDPKRALRGHKRFAKIINTILLGNAHRQYARSVFGKYEKFLKSIGVSLDYSDFVMKENIIRVGPKIGRNEPCLCGSGKKFKKCCGK